MSRSLAPGDLQGTIGRLRPQALDYGYTIETTTHEWKTVIVTW